MRRDYWKIAGVIACAIAVFFLSIVLSVAQTARTGSFFAWDYETAAITQQGIDRFEMQIDGGTWVNVGLNPSTADATTLPGYTTFRTPIPALTLGPHTVALRACNPQECSNPTTDLPFTFSIRPDTPRNPRLSFGN